VHCDLGSEQSTITKQPGSVIDSTSVNYSGNSLQARKSSCAQTLGYGKARFTWVVRNVGKQTITVHLLCGHLLGGVGRDASIVLGAIGKSPGIVSKQLYFQAYAKVQKVSSLNFRHTGLRKSPIMRMEHITTLLTRAASYAEHSQGSCFSTTLEFDDWHRQASTEAAFLVSHKGCFI
jgi:hypothetical protein